jgi:PAS domain S-box-containing protein
VLKMEEAGSNRLLWDLTLSLNLGNSLEEVFDLVYARLKPFVPYDRIAVATADEKRERLSIVTVRSEGKQILGKGYSGRIAGSTLEPLIREGRTRVINDLQAYLESKPASESTRLIVKEGMQSSLTLPLVVSGRPTGVMFFSTREKHAYRPEHEEFLRAIVGHIAIAMERSRLLDAVREKGEFLENVLHNSGDAIMATDAQGRIQTWNRGAHRIFGFEPQEVLGRDEGLLVPPDAASDQEALAALLKETGLVKARECDRLTRDGRRLRVELTVTQLRDKHGRPAGRSMILRDVTDVRRLQEELIASRSLAAVGELAATVAHEIKNPLAGISGAIQVLAQDTPRNDPRREIMDEILDQIRRLDRTVRDLLAFARPTQPARQEVALEDSLRKAWGLLAPQDDASRITWTLEGAEGVTVRVDPHLLHQVWVNLFQNAIEALSGKGSVEVRVRSGHGRVEVEVRDSGPGVEAEALERIFKPFYTTKTRGTGLGLPITRKIMEAHGGRIRAESEPGVRTSFFVEIPT